MLRRRLTRHTRADVLWGLFVFVAMQLGLALAIEYRLPQFRDPYYAYRAERLRRRTIGAKALSVVMLGSSRVQNGLKSSELGAQLRRKAGRDVVLFNFGVPACGPVMSLLYFERLRAEGVKPDLLLIEALPMMLGARKGDPSGNAPFESQCVRANRLWHHELAFVERYGFPAEEVRKGWWEYWPLPLYDHRFTILSRFLPNLVLNEVRQDQAWRIDESGWTNPKMRTVTAEFRERAQVNQWRDTAEVLARPKLCEVACQAQRDMLARCRDEGISVILVLMPEGVEFRSGYSDETLAQFEQHVQQLSREFAAPIVDARRWVADDKFYDGQHLQPDGAAVFTERLSRECLEPVLALDSADRTEYLASRARRDFERFAAGNSQARRTVGQAAAGTGRLFR